MSLHLMNRVARNNADRTLQLARELGVLRPRDLAQHGIAREYLSRLTQAGLLERTGRGLYVLPDAELTEHHSLAEAAKRVPAGIVCLLSALRFHDLTTQAPFEVWLALPPAARRPRAGSPPLRIVRFSGPALTEGIEEHMIEGVRVRVYNPAKTVADCFKYRNKIGLDVALEALRETWRERRTTMDELWRYAEICRVATVMRPYLESLITLEGLA
ncbi:MAG TPA: type IV toxin-antitoxin system AbiEi family antitoxin domain-containing protein [Candidatus Limnocylindria bacterium]|nr:type IV toxin-antitoxin system AbiEi family antitoxin domain-containing protein [Candidatus Limnocylindria bacterium]